MDFTNFFFGGNDDAPDYEVGSSLRFRHEVPTYLTNTGLVGSTLGDYTISVWIKKGNNLSANSSFIITSGTAGTNTSSLGYNNGGILPAFELKEMGESTSAGENFRCNDTHGWYHIVASNRNGPGAAGAADGPRQRLWVNGIKYGESSGTGSINLFSQSPVQIGLYADPSYRSTAWEGYMADFYFIDGKALAPTVFGGYNEDGVWEPRDPEFEANLQNYSAQVVGGPTGTWYATTTEPKTMFDGDLSTYCQTSDTVGTITWTPVEPIPYETSVRFYAINSAGDSVRLNGGASDNYGDGNGFSWKTLVTGSGVIEKIEWSGGYGGTVAAIEVDGVVLVDGPLYSGTAGDALFYDPQDSSDGTAEQAVDWSTTNPLGQGQTALFDGNLSSAVGPSPGGAVNGCIIWKNPIPVTVNQGIRVYIGSGGSGAQRFYINEEYSGQFSMTSPGWLDLSSANLTPPYTLESMGFKGYSGNISGFVCAIEVDGVMLLNGVGLDYGASGFHLDFSDPNDVGFDRSGNGNHFTPNGFDLTGYATGQFVHNDMAYDDATDTVPTGGSAAPYFIDIVDPQNTGFWSTYNPTGAFDGVVSGDGNTNGTYLYGGVGNTTCTELTFDLRDFPTVTNCAIWAGWNQADGSTSNARVHLLDASKTEIAGTNVTPVRIGNSCERLQMCGTDVGARYIKFDLSAADSYFYLWGIEVNGQLLSQIAKTAFTYDIVKDSPTNNYATTNIHLRETTPYYMYSDQVEYAMLSASTNSGVYKTHRSSIPPDHDCYWEVFYGSTPSSSAYSGLGTSTTDMGNTTEGFWGYSSASGSPGSYVQDGTGVTLPGSTPPAFSINDVAGFHWDYEGEQLTMYKNGTQIGQMSTSDRDGRQLFIHHRPYGGDNFSVNYGQQPFQYRPSQFGEETELNTENMVRPAVRNGTDHFVALQGPGQGANETPAAGQTAGSYSKDVFGGTSTTYEPNTVEKQFLPGAGDGYPPANMFDGSESTVCKTGNGNAQTWIYFRPEGGIEGVTSLVIQTSNAQTVIINDGEPTGQTSSGDASTYDITIANPPSTLTSIAIQGNTISSATISKITINGNVLVDFDIMTQAQRTFPQGLWWIKSRSGTDQHQFGDFKTGLTVVSTSPTISQAIPYVAPSESAVMAWCWNAANPAASGFNIVEYTGQNPTVTTIEHGLTKAPEFIITMAKSGTQRNYAVYHKSLGAGKWLQLNDLENALDDATMWNNTEPTDTTFQVGAANTTNFSGANYMAYCWTSVPGFSAFGTYNGNGVEENGPYQWLGFEPACVMFKRTNARTNWMIFDNNRNPINTQNEGVALYPDGAEAEGGGYKIDFLASGFKIRGSESLWNDTAGSEYIYCAWAKHPFNSPGLAR